MIKYQEVPRAKLVEVIAPASLEEGYEFDALYQGQTFRVKVPQGGVEQGHHFQAPFDPNPHQNQDQNSHRVNTADEAPRGYWKDGLCDCCTFGICHPSLLNAFVLPQILLAQVMTRMQLNIWALPATSPQEMTKTFPYMVYIVLAYCICTMIYPNTTPFYSLAGAAFTFYTVLTMMRTRRAVREHYDIPDQTQCCGVTDDCCCSFWCGLCTVSQLARQTADYEITDAKCFSETGLRRAAPVMTV